MIAGNAKRNSVADVVRRFQAGQLAEARRMGEALLAASPADASLAQLVGVICCQAGALDRGIALLQQSMQSAPADANARFNLARALLDADRLADAERLCAERPSDPQLQRLRAQALKGLDRLPEAASAYERVLAASPADAESWNNLGTIRLAMDDASGALQAFERARKLDPSRWFVHTNLARALAMLDRHAESLEAARRGAELGRDEAAAQYELGRAFNRMRAGLEALHALSNAARLSPKDAEIMTALALTLAGLGEIAKAEQGFRLAIKLDPAKPEAYHGLAALLEQSNRTADLCALVDDAERAIPPTPAVDFLRALGARTRGDFAEALQLAERAASPSVDEIVRNQLIGQMADRLGDTDTAFAAFKKMNQAMGKDPSAAPYDGSEHRRYVEELIALTTAEWYRSWAPVSPASDPPAPTFLVGFPRSGTTLLDTILMGHGDVHVLEEEPVTARVHRELGAIHRIAELDRRDVERLRAVYFQELQAVAPASAGKHVIDKLPLNILRVPLIHRIFPDAKFIFAARHPCDVVLSCFMQNFQVNQAMASFLKLDDAALFYDRVLTYWTQCGRTFPITSYIVRYEAMVTDLAGEMHALMSYLGLPWDEAMLDHQATAGERGHIRTPSYAQVAEPIYARASGRWQRYRTHMEKVLPILAPWAERLGYDRID